MPSRHPYRASGLVQCTLCRCRHKVHKHRNLLAHAPERLHEEISNDYKDMIYAQTKQEIEARRKAFIRKWRAWARRWPQTLSRPAIG